MAAPEDREGAIVRASDGKIFVNDGKDRWITPGEVGYYDTENALQDEDFDVLWSPEDQQ